MKFLKDDNRYTFITSGSQFGITLKQTHSVPIGYVEMINMYPLNFEEFLFANDCNEEFILNLKSYFSDLRSIPENIHKRMMSLFREYLLVGGMPASVNDFLENKNIFQVRSIHENIHRLYYTDASKYDFEHKLKIKRIYETLPSFLENKKKRVIATSLPSSNKHLEAYRDEFDYIISSGIGIEVKAVSNPVFPLLLSSRKIC